MSHPRQVVGWAAWFAVLGDPSRLMLLVLIARDGPISVSDLAAASGLKATTVSHSLRLLRVHEMVRTERDGHTVLYRSAPHPVTDLLDRVVDPAGPDHEDAPR
ncbi:metalloregulator ArsR/SmtB family transcription factor [Pseudonocardia petroleophila]|uniref:Helix-turn-helix transcriptional regulator n=1 Tax=Pseudonocardia petroleophila TaxID=37331 RepID=A0A7G7MGM3_9PSEU|nr:metalloregulator ArsR/SmtB family transcription factor [Pseudonocardia petroleophila]QNG51934.1 helix-turn-helix transcriptional regulator [Pseudonocardia petroleophila]